MANVGISSIKLIDNDGDVATVTNNKLDVNATLVAGATIDIGDVEITGHSTIGHGNNTAVSNSASERITAVSTACKHIDIMAATANTGIIYVGGSGVTSATGVALYAGDVYSADIDDLSEMFVISSVDGEDVQWVYYV